MSDIFLEEDPEKSASTPLWPKKSRHRNIGSLVRATSFAAAMALTPAAAQTTETPAAPSLTQTQKTPDARADLLRNHTAPVISDQASLQNILDKPTDVYLMGEIHAELSDRIAYSAMFPAMAKNNVRALGLEISQYLVETITSDLDNHLPPSQITDDCVKISQEHGDSFLTPNKSAKDVILSITSLIQKARENGIKVYGIDARTNNDNQYEKQLTTLRSGKIFDEASRLEAMDWQTAQNVRDIHDNLQQQGGGKVAVLFGNIHLLTAEKTCQLQDCSTDSLRSHLAREGLKTTTIAALPEKGLAQDSMDRIMHDKFVMGPHSFQKPDAYLDVPAFMDNLKKPAVRQLPASGLRNAAWPHTSPDLKL